LKKEQKFDRYPDSVVPGAGGTSLHVVAFPPGSVFASSAFDPEAARLEALVRLRGLADHFEKEDPAMHKTNTVDYSMVVDGEVWLEVDDRETVHLRKGDCSCAKWDPPRLEKQRFKSCDDVVLSLNGAKP
jgi:hypothetical protein